MVMYPAQAPDHGSSCDLPVTVEYKSERGDMERISNDAKFPSQKSEIEERPPGG